MKVYAVGNQKGDSGKTTLAVNLAAAWSEAGRAVLQVAEHAGGGLESLLAGHQ